MKHQWITWIISTLFLYIDMLLKRLTRRRLQKENQDKAGNLPPPSPRLKGPEMLKSLQLSVMGTWLLKYQPARKLRGLLIWGGYYSHLSAKHGAKSIGQSNLPVIIRRWKREKEVYENSAELKIRFFTRIPHRNKHIDKSVS